MTDNLMENDVRQKTLSSRKKSRMIFYVSMIALPVVQFLIFYLYINLNSFTLAFQEFSYEKKGYVFYGFNNFKAIFSDFSTLAYLKNSVWNSLELFVWTMIFGAAVAILFSYYIYKKNPGHSAFKIFLYLPHILGGVVVVIMYKYFMDIAVPEVASLFGKNIEGMLANPKTVRSTIIFYTIYTSFGTQVLIYSSTMSGISDSIIESAQLDGITPIKELIYIILPSIWNTFVTFMVTSVVGIFTNQMSLYTFYGTTADYSLYTFGYYLYRGVIVATNVEYPYLSAMGFLLTIIAIPLTLGTKWALSKFGPTTD